MIVFSIQNHSLVYFEAGVHQIFHNCPKKCLIILFFIWQPSYFKILVYFTLLYLILATCSYGNKIVKFLVSERVYFIFLYGNSSTDPLHSYNVVFTITVDSVFRSECFPEKEWVSEEAAWVKERMKTFLIMVVWIIYKNFTLVQAQVH